MKTILYTLLLLAFLTMAQAQESHTYQTIIKHFPEMKEVLVYQGQGKILDTESNETLYEDEVLEKIVDIGIRQYQQTREEAMLIKMLSFIGDTGASSEMYFPKLEHLLRINPKMMISAANKLPKNTRAGLVAQFQGLQGMRGVKVPQELLK